MKKSPPLDICCCCCGACWHCIWLCYGIETSPKDMLFWFWIGDGVAIEMKQLGSGAGVQFIGGAQKPGEVDGDKTGIPFRTLFMTVITTFSISCITSSFWSEFKWILILEAIPPNAKSSSSSLPRSHFSFSFWSMANMVSFISCLALAADV